MKDIGNKIYDDKIDDVNILCQDLTDICEALWNEISILWDSKMSDRGSITQDYSMVNIVF